LTPEMQTTVARQQEAIVNLQLELTEIKKHLAPFVEAYKRLSSKVGEEEAGVFLQMCVETLETVKTRDELRKDKEKQKKQKSG